MNYFLNLLLIFFMLTFHQNVIACSRLLRVDKEAIMVARTMDWYADMKTQLWVYPRGLVHEEKGVNPMKWKSKYGSIVATAYDQITTDGFNEHGLAAHILELKESNYGKRDPKLPGLLVTSWAQFYLDNFQTVEEAVNYTKSKPLQILPFMQPETKEWVRLHLALEDAKGDSAIIEYTDGKPNIYHNRDYIVLTNSPVYNRQLRNLRHYQEWGGKERLPGTSSAQDRFVRALYHTKHLPPATSIQAELSDVLGVIRNVSEPISKPKKKGDNVSWTLWRSVSDLSHKVYYFDDPTRTGLIWVKLNQFNLLPGQAVMKLDLTKPTILTGDMTDQFQAVS